MISKSIIIPLALVVLATLFISTSNGNEYVLADPFNNDVKIKTDSEYRLDCDEYDIGTNGAICANEDLTTTDGIDITGENNKVTSDTHVSQVQKCDESDNGDNNAFCSNSSENFLDAISVSGNNNNINYDINT